MIEIDGSIEEGGGAILRLALSLSTITGKPFRMKNIRVNRSKPGLKHQHIIGIRALQELSNAKVADAFPESSEITFIPGKLIKKRILIEPRTAASITLILQSLLPAIIMNGKRTVLELTGGTDVSWSPQIDYFTNVFAYTIKELAEIKVKLLKRGYYPKGGGHVEITIIPKNVKELNFCDRGKLIQIGGMAHASIDLEKPKVSERMAEAARQYLNHNYIKHHGNYPLVINSSYQNTLSPGAGITLWAQFTNSTLGVDKLGKKGVSSEALAETSSKELLNMIDQNIAIDPLLADQLIIYLALCGGKLETSEITPHTKANIHICESFLDINFIILKNRISCKKN